MAYRDYAVFYYGQANYYNLCQNCCDKITNVVFVPFRAQKVPTSLFFLILPYSMLI